MTETLLTPTMVAVFARERTHHAFHVTVIGNDREGYRAAPITNCGRLFDGRATTREGFVNCKECEATP